MLRSGLRAALEAVTDAPAIVITSHLDVLAANLLGEALFSPVLAQDHANLARFLFLDEDLSTTFYPEWDRVADEYITQLHAAAGHDAHDRALHRLIGELATRSVPFRSKWSSRRVGVCRPARLVIDHPLVGELVLTKEDLVTTFGRPVTIRICTAQPGTAGDERLRIFASWSHDDEGEGHD